MNRLHENVVSRRTSTPYSVMRSGALLFLATVLVLVTSCVDPGGGRRGAAPVENAVHAGRLSLFLNLRNADGPGVAMTLSAVELQNDSGAWLTRSLTDLKVDAVTVGSGQMFLARMVLPPGKYRKLRLVVDGADQERVGNHVPLALQDSLVELPLRNVLQMAVGDSRSLFLTWDTRASVKNGVFYPIIQVRPSLKKLIADVAYVACPEIDTVFMINTDTNRVIDSLGIPDHPTYIFQSRLFERDKVFVLTETALMAFSPTTNEIVERNSLAMIREPVHMAFHPEGRWAYILDRQRSSVARLDLNSGAIDTQVRLSYEPDFVLFLARANLLAVSLGRGQAVVLLSPETLKTVGTISTGMAPAGLLDWDDHYLFIAESGSNSVMVYDYEKQAMLKRIQVGFQPMRLTGSTSFVYAANQGSRSIAVLHPGILDLSRVIPVDGTPLELAYVGKSKWVYAGNEAAGAIDVIESTTSEVAGRIELGAVPQGIFVLQ